MKGQKLGTGNSELVRSLNSESANLSANYLNTVRSSITQLKNNKLNENDIWLTVNESANLLGITKRAIQKKIKDGHFVTRVVTGRGGKRYEIALSSLPVEAQVKYYEAQGNEFRAPVIRNDFVSEKALAKHDLLLLYEKAFAHCKHGERKAAKETFVALYNKGTFGRLYETLGPVSYATLERWRKEWEIGGRIPDVLEDQYRSPSKTSVSAEQSTILLKHFLSPNKPPIKEAIRLAKQEMQLKGIGFSQSDITFYRYLRGWISQHMPIYTFVRYGGKKLNDELLPFIMRDYSRIEVGDILVADGHVLNFELINPFTGKPKRMNLIVFFDMKSGLPVGWEIMPTENTAVIGAALRRAIMLLGRLFGYQDKGLVPRIVYIDNGRAFKGKYFMGVNDFREEGLQGLYGRLGIKTIIAKAYHGQSKTVERFFGSLGEFERQIISYVGRGIDSKPARLLRNEKAHVNAYKALTGGRAPELATALTALHEWILDYAQRPHQDGYFKGYAPLEIFEESMKKVKALPDFESRLVSHERLNFLMMEERTAKFYRNGIRFNNRYYWNEALYGRRQPVIFKYDLMFPEKILVFEPTGEFICEAYLPERVHPAAAVLGTDADKELLRRQLELQARLKKETVEVGKVLLNAGLSAEFDGDSSSRLGGTQNDDVEKKHQKKGSIIGQLVAAADAEKAAEPEEPIFVWEFERRAWEREQARRKGKTKEAATQSMQSKKKAV